MEVGWIVTYYTTVVAPAHLSFSNFVSSCPCRKEPEDAESKRTKYPAQI